MPENDNKTPRFGNIKDELFLISFIVLAGGLVSIDAYFQVFGIKFESLDFSAMYVIYKGMIMITNHPSLLIPYLLTVLLLVFELIAIKRRWNRFLLFRTPIAYLLLLAILLLIFPLARHAGQDQASRDMSRTTSSLPVITQLETKTETIPPMARYRLLLIDKDFIYIFDTTEDISTSPPIIDRIPKSDVIRFKTQIK
ncbi:hypothetical protein [Chitinophaga sp. Cy-1792]|uniref:hypothetical protein n=1 Tax=Chitinophaga sp. Cy-1792 TaxID=2608339 RepID=UPI00141FFC0D|nr:hypothetical protein [Chitinophaga sp. Cy-1792]NIG56761.1 hypothetical protein [Chitinophaga sp. Cy-1792]